MLKTQSIKVSIDWQVTIVESFFKDGMWEKSNPVKKKKNGTKPSNTSDKIKMPKSTTRCQIKSFILNENMDVEKLRDT